MVTTLLWIAAGLGIVAALGITAIVVMLIIFGSGFDDREGDDVG